MQKTERTCGGCTACCKLPPISDKGFEKGYGEWCRFCIQGTGCGAYEKRPRTCRRYACAWLAGAGSETDRPDTSGVLCCFYHYPDTGRTMVIMELFAGGLDSAFAVECRSKVLARGEAVMTIPVSGQVRMWLPRERHHITRLNGDTIDDGRRAQIAYA